jgi:sugar lactone lactonase YvrE
MKAILLWVVLASATSALVAQGPSTSHQSGDEAPLRVVTIAGVAGQAGLRDGDPPQALFNHPTWLEYDESGRVYLVDRQNGVLRAIAPFGVYTLTVVKSPGRDDPVALNFGPSFGGGIASEPRVAGCGGGQYSEALFVSNTGLHEVIMVTDPSREGAWTVGVGFLAERDDRPTHVGIAGQAGSRDGYAHTFYYPDDLALLDGPGDVALCANYKGDAWKNDSIYIADTGNHAIRRVWLSGSFEGCSGLWEVETVAGAPGVAGFSDGAGSHAKFNTPRGIAVASDGGVYVSDAGNHVIRHISPTGDVTTVAGQPGIVGNTDGPALQARLNTPAGLAITDEGELIIADSMNHCIRKLTLDGRLISIAGSCGVGGYADGDASTARFAGPVGVALSPEGILVADTSNNVIRRIEPFPSRLHPARPGN